jgi:branched-chain amino acid transport system permease protein
MVGAYCGYYLAPHVARFFPVPSLPAASSILVLAMAACTVLGIVIEKLAYRPLRQRPKLTVLITAIGVSLFLEYAGQKFFGADPKKFPELIVNHQLVLPGALVITTNQLLVLSVTLLLLLALRLIVLRTRIGLAMRAVSFNADAASLMGINIDVVISFTFGLGSALAAAGGILYALNYPSIDPLMGMLPGLKAFVAAVLGGIGNLPGAALGGLLLGVTETLVAGYVSSTYRDAIAFAVLVVILLVKPSGLLGKTEVEKV